jgi:uncharacterized damage-inducible protein DinB
MARLRSLVVAVYCAAPLALAAQAGPVTAATRDAAKDLSKNLLAAAQDMPAAKYGFKPTAGQMTFGELIVHIQDDNRITCAAIAGAAPAAAATLKPTDPKEKLVQALEQSFAVCDSALAQLADAKMGDAVTWYGQSTTRATAAMGLLMDWADHYSQQAGYLRLNGVLPPTARKGGM